MTTCISSDRFHILWPPWVATLSSDLEWRPWVATLSGENIPYIPVRSLKGSQDFCYNWWPCLTYNATHCISSDRFHILWPPWVATLSGDLGWRPWVANTYHILPSGPLRDPRIVFYNWWPFLKYNATTCISRDRFHILWPPWVATLSGHLEWPPWVATLSCENIPHFPLRSLTGSQVFFYDKLRF